jgi:hypothetical protein
MLDPLWEMFFLRIERSGESQLCRCRSTHALHLTQRIGGSPVDRHTSNDSPLDIHLEHLPPDI